MVTEEQPINEFQLDTEVVIQAILDEVQEKSLVIAKYKALIDVLRRELKASKSSVIVLTEKIDELAKELDSKHNS